MSDYEVAVEIREALREAANEIVRTMSAVAVEIVEMGDSVQATWLAEGMPHWIVGYYRTGREGKVVREAIQVSWITRVLDEGEVYNICFGHDDNTRFYLEDNPTLVDQLRANGLVLP